MCLLALCHCPLVLQFCHAGVWGVRCGGSVVVI